MAHEASLERIRKAVVSLSVAETQAATKQAVADGIPVNEIIKEGLAAGLTDVGERWQRKEMFISHVLVAAKAMKAGQDLLEQALVGQESRYIATVVMGTPKGDLHDIGKNLVVMMMKAAGFQVVDLGVDVEPQSFVDKAKEVDADLIGMSLVMSICLDQLEKVCQLVTQSGLRAKTLIGGPATSELIAEKIGADAYGGFDAPTGVRIAKNILGLQ